VRQTYLYQVKILGKRLAILYLLYFICRVLFLLFNRDMFAEVGFRSFIVDCFFGMRFDTFAVCVANALFIILSLLPIKQFYSQAYQKFLKYMFIILNSVCVLSNCVDIAYFPFIRKRSGADLFHQLGGQTDIGKLLPQYIRDFWWVLVIFILLVTLMVWLYNRIKIEKTVLSPLTIKSKLSIAVIFILSCGLTFLGIRGGGRIPIDIIDAGIYAPANEVPIVLNTTFTLLKSLDKKGLKEYKFYNETELRAVYSPVYKANDTATFKKKNVVILILESYSKEYTAMGKTGTSYTPFLDSLSRHCYVFSNSFANGSKSIEGIPAILSGLPHLMENPYINSAYSGNVQTSLASILGKEGYSTAFFHGGINGTMNFDSYAKMAGYQNYFGRNEYNNDDDFDGFWGIWDEPYLQYAVKKMGELEQPFHSSIFTLSSHHPYFVPEKYKGKFPKGTLENSASIAYTDLSLRKFFESAEKTSWYKNTLFILVADHTSLSDHKFYKNIAGQQCIPILFYSPGDSLKGEDNRSFSQIDILPSVLDYLGYNKSFFAFGQSYLRKQNNNCYYYTNGNHMLVADSVLLSFNNSEIRAVYNFKRDSTLEKNLKGKYLLLETSLSRQFRAFIQTHNSAIVNNKMFLITNNR
jgi:phosphoglycerol transferase MdoB-like AlkP superfamily enzyme